MKPLSYILFFLGIAGFFYGFETGSIYIQAISKTLPLIVLIVSVRTGKSSYNKLISTGLILSLIGDIMLTQLVDRFLFGLIAFLLAHVVYIFAFLKKSTRLALIESIPFYAYGAILFYFLHNHLGTMKIPVLVYIIVITTMLWRSYVQYKSGKQAKYAFYGTLFFVMSDTMIAIYRFYQPFDFDREATILSYWAAQYLIFLSTTSKKLRYK